MVRREVRGAGRRGRFTRAVTIILLITAACGPGRDYVAEKQVVRATLTELFAKRERARAITVWHDPREQAPTLSAFGGPFDHHDTLTLQVVDTTGMGLPFVVEHTTLREISAFFAEHPGGWDRWLEDHPGNAGVVEVVKPRVWDDSAAVVVGRACGEMCRSAWRVSLVRADTTWRVKRVQLLSVPK